MGERDKREFANGNFPVVFCDTAASNCCRAWPLVFSLGLRYVLPMAIKQAVYGKGAKHAYG